MTKETAIVIWNSKTKTEHFIRQANFNTEAKDFGFIVPLPSVPDFAVANPDAFSLLESLVPPPIQFGCSKPTETSGPPASAMVILKEERVGDYIATVIKATDAAAMSSWLKKNGFKPRPQMSEWLDYYNRKNWVFAALKYAAKKGRETRTRAIRISFKTDKPHYPYKMPSDAFKPGWTRPLKLYVISDTPIQAEFMDGGSQWQGELQWSGPLPKEKVGTLATDLNLKSTDFPSNAVVSIFNNAHRESKYTDDLAFVATTDFGKYIWGAVILILGGAWFYTRRNRSLAPAGA